MKRRLDIAIGLVHRPRVLFLDEPTTGLDPEARAALWVEVERLAEQESLTILLTTHYLEEADRLAERVAIVSRGKVVVEGTPEELKANLRGELVTVELGDVNGRIEDAAEIVRTIDGASEVGVDGRLVRARVPNGAQAIPTILSTLDSRGFQVESVTTARPSLDDVYLHYTGRDFATEDAGGGSDPAAAPDRLDDRPAAPQSDARADLDLVMVDPAADLAAALRAALLARRRAARRRLELHRVPDAGDHLHERVLRRQLVRDGDDHRPRPARGRPLSRRARHRASRSSSRRSCARASPRSSRR